MNAMPVRTVFLHVTKACNLRCAYCYFSAHRPLPDEADTSEVIDWLTAIATLGPEKVVFTGGEPLLRPDLVDLLAAMRAADPEHRVLRCLNTNGHLVTAEIARALVGLADEVRVSVDALATRNDRLRGTGSFEHALRALETFRAVGFEPKALVTVTRESLPDLEELIGLLLERKITRINVNPFRPAGRGAGRPDWQVDLAGVAHAVASALGRRGVETRSALSMESDVQQHCGVGRFLNLMPNGDVFPCHVLTDPRFRCGSLRHESLGAICRRNGLMDRLASLDFATLAGKDPRLATLTAAGTCLAETYRAASDSPAWEPLLEARPGRGRSTTQPGRRRH